MREKDVDSVVLSERESRTVLHRVILPTAEKGAVRQARPVVVIVGGQPGAGKTQIANLVQATLDRRGGAVRVGRDAVFSAQVRAAPAARGPGSVPTQPLPTDAAEDLLSAAVAARVRKLADEAELRDPSYGLRAPPQRNDAEAGAHVDSPYARTRPTATRSAPASRANSAPVRSAAERSHIS